MKNKDRYILVAVVVLIVLNIFSWGLLWTQDRPQNERPLAKKETTFSRPGNFLIKRLGFSETQIQEFEKMQKQHFTRLRKFDQKYKLLRDEYISLIISPDFESQKADSIFREMTLINGMIQKANWNHFLNIYQLCDENQKKEFRKLFTMKNKRHNKDRYSPVPRNR
jgi:hypothetical protein